jgi:hypothetical protein
MYIFHSPNLKPRNLKPQNLKTSNTITLILDQLLPAVWTQDVKDAYTAFKTAKEAEHGE